MLVDAHLPHDLTPLYIAHALHCTAPLNLDQRLTRNSQLTKPYLHRCFPHTLNKVRRMSMPELPRVHRHT